MEDKKMKAKCIDLTGRLVIPQPVRVAAGINSGDPLDIYEENGRIIIVPLHSNCAFCGSEENLLEFNDKKICKKCLDTLKKL